MTEEMLSKPLLYATEIDFQQHVVSLPYAFGGPIADGVLKKSAEDFIVNEVLSFTPEGEGEHVYLYIQKTNLNTEDVAKILARHANVIRRSVSFAGMKDRNAVTQQWFSVHLPGVVDPDWSILNTEDLLIKQVVRHQRKLKRGAIKENQFIITLNDAKADKELLLSKLDLIKRTGIPNYFMGQRFGYKANNLTLTYRLFSQNKKIKDRNKKGILLSAVRSYLFNHVLSQRVVDGSWCEALTGDAFVLNGTRNFFENKLINDEIEKRIEEKDIHPSGLLFGKGKQTVHGTVLKLEEQVVKDNSVFCEGLLKEKVESSRRALRTVVNNLNVEFTADNQVRLSFNLASGSYATAVIRELFNVNRG
jgi:tRNA pseudouridine13 synthase